MKELEMITKSGLVIVSETSIECAGFEFDGQNPEFDGCRMGQLLPLLWLKKRVDEKVTEYMTSTSPYGIEGQFNYGFYSELVAALCDALKIPEHELLKGIENREDDFFNSLDEQP